MGTFHQILDAMHKRGLFDSHLHFEIADNECEIVSIGDYLNIWMGQKGFQTKITWNLIESPAKSLREATSSYRKYLIVFHDQDQFSITDISELLDILLTTPSDLNLDFHVKWLNEILHSTGFHQIIAPIGSKYRCLSIV